MEKKKETEHWMIKKNTSKLFKSLDSSINFILSIDCIKKKKEFKKPDGSEDESRTNNSG